MKLSLLNDYGEGIVLEKIKNKVVIRVQEEPPTPSFRNIESSIPIQELLEFLGVEESKNKPGRPKKDSVKR